MKKLLTLTLLSVNGIIAFAQTTQAQKTIPQQQLVKTIPQPGLNAQGNTKDTTNNTSPADSLYRHLPDAKERQPLVIVNSNIIAGFNY